MNEIPLLPSLPSLQGSSGWSEERTTVGSNHRLLLESLRSTLPEKQQT